MQGPLTFDEITERYHDYSLTDEKLGRRQFFRYKSTVEELMPLKIELSGKKYSLIWDENVTNDKEKGGLWGSLLAQAQLGDMVNLMSELSNNVALLQPATGEEQLKTVLLAIKKGKAVHGTYTSRCGEEPKRRIWIPVFAALWDSRWYMIAECTKHPGSLAVYALERFSYLALTKDKYKLTAERKTAAKYFKSQYGVYGPDFKAPNYPLEIRIKASNDQMKYLTSPLFHPSMKVVKQDEYYTTFTIKVVPNHNLYQKLLSFGPEIEILSPSQVREHISELITSMHHIYT